MSVPLPQPSEPFVGLRAYTIADQRLFLEREEETGQLKDMIMASRIVLLYGDSGNGKSSLINAGLAPALQRSAPGFQPERVRITPDLQALTFDSEPLAAPGVQPFRSIFADEPGGEGSSPANRRISVGELADGLKRGLVAAPSSDRSKPPRRVLLMFDQFEELCGFVGGRAAFSVGGNEGRSWTDAAAVRQRQRDLAAAIGGLLADEDIRRLPAKFLFIFREEYLAKLLALVPELNSAESFRLASMMPDAYARIIGGPFRASPTPGPFAESPPADFFRRVAAPVGEAFRQRAAGSGQSILTEIQVYGGELWRDAALRAAHPTDPGQIADGIPAILASFFQRVVDRLGQLQVVAIAVLCEMVTTDKTRNVVSEATLLDLLVDHGDPTRSAARFSKEDVHLALDQLETSRIINRSERSGARFYDLVSEALIPWLSRERRSHIETLEHARERVQIRQRRLRWVFGGILALSIISIGVWLAFLEKERETLTSQVAARDAEQQARLSKEAASKANLERRLAELNAQNAQNQVSAKSQESARLTDALNRIREAARTAPPGEIAQQVVKVADQAVDPLVARLADHRGAVTVAAFSRDGKWVATGSDDHQIRVWTTAGKLVANAVVSTGDDSISALAFTPDSRALLTCAGTETARWFTWTGQSLTPVPEFQLPGSTVSDVDFSPDGRLGVCTLAEGKALLLQMPVVADSLGTNASKTVQPALPTVLATWQQTPKQDVSEARFSADGKRVVTSSDDHTVRIYSTDAPYALVPDAAGKNPRNLGAPTRGFRFSPVDAILVAGGAGNENLVWWRPTEPHNFIQMRDHTNSGPVSHVGAVLNVAFDPAGNYLASVGTDGRCLVWNAQSQNSLVAVPTEITGRIFDCAWIGDRLALVGEDGWMEIWGMENPYTPRRVFSVHAHQGPAWRVRFSPGGDLLLTWSNFPPEEVPAPKGAAATNFQRPATGNPVPDNTAALWDLKWCEHKGWTKH